LSPVYVLNNFQIFTIHMQFFNHVYYFSVPYDINSFSIVYKAQK
jgi:hypothetical protein